ncbi:hypothetical protein MMC07_008388 [Pseudocyphellaria aurata]|nr:hypothetical protein [Pseudocyphellaria aurata]
MFASPVALIVGICICYIIGLGVYRLWLSPIASFPGPKLAALTGWYEFYYDVIFNGSYLYKIEEMHRQFGPIVRINPAELSINDPQFYSQIYVTANVRRTEKYAALTEGVNMNGAHTFTPSHDLHRRRRQPLDPFFSKTGIIALEPMLKDSICRLCERLEGFKNSSAVIRLDHAFFAMTGDVISRISYDEHQSLVEDPDFSPFWFASIQRCLDFE